MVFAFTLLLLLAGAVGLALWLSRRLGESGAETARMLDELLAVRNREVDGRLEAITATMDRRLGELDTKVDRRLEHAAKQTNAIHKQLGEVGQATVQMAEQAKGLSQLQEILRPPKARGGFGELLLENLLRDRLPATAF
jgi:DNA recombination protein RmuC